MRDERILTADEAICLVLAFAKDNYISSETKLNKLVARLNLHFIPVDVKFSLNKFGSFPEDLPQQTSLLYEVKEYEYNETLAHSYRLKNDGRSYADSTVLRKLRTILDESEIQKLRFEILNFSQLSANEISNDEHEALLVDVEDRFKLKQKVNSVNIDLFDLYEEMKKKPRDTFAQISLAALIEYCYFLTKYLREVRFARLDEREYDYEAYMLDYYFLYNIGKLIPFLKENVKSAHKDLKRINRYYDYIIASCKNYRYPFSLENEHLMDLAVG